MKFNFQLNQFLSSNCAHRIGRALFGAIVDLAPRKSEPRPGRRIFQLKPIWEAADFMCADPRHQSGVLDRTVHIRDTRNRQIDELDHFFGALSLPGILQIMG